MHEKQQNHLSSPLTNKYVRHFHLIKIYSNRIHSKWDNFAEEHKRIIRKLFRRTILSSSYCDCCCYSINGWKLSWRFEQFSYTLFISALTVPTPHLYTHTLTLSKFKWKCNFHLSWGKIVFGWLILIACRPVGCLITIILCQRSFLVVRASNASLFAFAQLIPPFATFMHVSVSLSIFTLNFNCFNNNCTNYANRKKLSKSGLLLLFAMQNLLGSQNFQVCLVYMYLYFVQRDQTAFSNNTYTERERDANENN